MEGLAAVNPNAFKSVISDSADIKRLAKQALPTGGSTRTPSFLEPIWTSVLICPAMLEATGVPHGAPDDETLTAVLAALDSKIEGQQEAVTLSYTSEGRNHKVRLTLLSEDRAAEGKLSAALDKVEAASEKDFEAISLKARKNVKGGRIDAETRAEYLAKFDEAVSARKAALEGTNMPPSAPPVPPSE